MLAAIGIVAGGFFSASLFGPPEQNLAADSNAASQHLANWESPRLEPLDSASDFSPQDNQLSSRESPQSEFSFDSESQFADSRDSFRAAESPESWGSPNTWARTWDRSIAPANHLGSDTGFGDDREVSTVELNQDSAPGWPSRRLEPLPSVNRHAASFRGEADAAPIVGPQSSFSPPASSPGLSDARFSGLTPPDLMDYDSAQTARPSRFPARPPQTQTQTQQGDPAPFGGPVLQSPQFDPAPDEARHNNWQSEGPRAWSMSAPLPTREPQQTMQPGQVTQHVVSDGDSLPKLAERYLQDASRARELYELNKEVLMSPDLLPIGVQIKVPSRSSYAESDPAQYEVFDSRGSATRQFAPQRLAPQGLAPLPEVAQDAAPTPRAWLQRPIESTFVGNDS